MLKAAAEQPGSHVVHSLYALALIDAEGGHYQEVRRAATTAAAAAAIYSPGLSVAWVWGWH
jgi:hypothetical protein